MKSFMSAQSPNATKVAQATECGDCSTKAVKSSGQENIESAAAKPEGDAKADQVVVMQGPLGTAITEALNKSQSKYAQSASVQIPNTGLESNLSEYVQANGQINNSEQFITRISKATGLVPSTDEKPTAVNTLLDCASRVEDIEFILVNKIESAPSQASVPQKSIIEAYNGDTVVANESLIIDSVQVVVTYRKGVGNRV